VSFDIQFISIADDIKVLSATDVENADPRAVRLICDGDVRYAQTVSINGLDITDFSVVSNRTLLAFPGDTFDGTTVAQMTFTIISSRWTSGSRIRLVFTPTLNITKVEGMQKLVQQLLKSMLSNSGSNRFVPSEGGDVLRALGLSLDPNAKAQIAAVLTEAASRTEQHFIAAQAGRALPPSERLLSFQFSKVSFEEDSQQAVAYLRLITYAGQAVSVPLVL
tara:strand:+ start:475 stop:1137 length:663 start_codon:yes stop_codon:yes gene_type:complete